MSCSCFPALSPWTDGVEDKETSDSSTEMQQAAFGKADIHTSHLASSMCACEPPPD
jgi:hypothetical protein